MEIPSALSRLRQLVYFWCKFVLSSFVIMAFSKHENVIYLTFDDGPCEKNTEIIFNTLMDMGVNAGFFFNGDAVTCHRELVQKIHSLGFFVGNHSYYHNKYAWNRWSQELGSINKGEEVIESITHRRNKIYRPPFGSITPVTFLYLLFNKYKIVNWSIDSRDFEAHDIIEIMEKISEVKNGDILLFHSDCDLTASHLQSIIYELSAKGYRFGNLSSVLQ